MNLKNLWVLAAVCGMAALISQSAEAVSVSDLPNVSLLTPYTVFGNDINLNLATVNGNAGISANGKFTMSSPSFVSGRLDEDSGVNNSIANPSHIAGGINTGLGLSAAQAEVFSASDVLKSLTPDFSLGNVITAQTFAAAGPVTVIDMNSLTLGGSNNITFNGSAGDFFVLNIAGKLALNGSSIIGAGNIAPYHILINLYDDSGNLGTAAHINNVLNGSVLIPFDTAIFHSMNGAIWAGDAEITLMSGATLKSVPLVPEPSTITLLAIAGGLGAVYRARQRGAR